MSQGLFETFFVGMVRFNAIRPSTPAEWHRAAALLSRLTGRPELLDEWGDVMVLLTTHVAQHLSGAGVGKAGWDVVDELVGVAAAWPPSVAGTATAATTTNTYPTESPEEEEEGRKEEEEEISSRRERQPQGKEPRSLSPRGLRRHLSWAGGPRGPAPTSPSMAQLQRRSLSVEDPPPPQAASHGAHFASGMTFKARATTEGSVGGGGGRTSGGIGGGLGEAATRGETAARGPSNSGEEGRSASVRMKHFFQRITGAAEVARPDAVVVLLQAEVPFDERAAAGRRVTFHGRFCDLGTVLSQGGPQIMAMWANFLCTLGGRTAVYTCRGTRTLSRDQVDIADTVRIMHVNQLRHLPLPSHYRHMLSGFYVFSHNRKP